MFGCCVCSIMHVYWKEEEAVTLLATLVPLYSGALLRWYSLYAQVFRVGNPRVPESRDPDWVRWFSGQICSNPGTRTLEIFDEDDVPLLSTRVCCRVPLF